MSMTAQNNPENLNQNIGTQPIAIAASPSVRAARSLLNRPPRTACDNLVGSLSATQPHPARRMDGLKPNGRFERTLSSRYRILGQLGTGAMGKVYRALDLQRKRHCAIKLISPDAPASLQAHQRFMNEAQIVSRLSHPNIIEVYEFNEDRDGTPYLVMELLEGEDLQDRVNRIGRLPLEYCLRILAQVGAGIHYAHELGVVHRDIKPNNIFLCQQSSPLGKEPEQAKILDFGLAKLIADGGRGIDAWSIQQEPLTRGIVVGTPAYMSPETLLGETEIVDPRSDQWALAVIAYEMLSGRLPFDHEDHEDPYRICSLICTEEPIPLRMLVPGLPPHVYYAIEVAMSKRREHRFSSIADFLRTLANQPLRGQPPAGVVEGAAQVLPSQLSPVMASAPQQQLLLPPAPGELRTVEYSAAELQTLTRKAREMPGSAAATPQDVAPAPPAAAAPAAPFPVVQDCRETLLFDGPMPSVAGPKALVGAPPSVLKWQHAAAALLAAGALLLGGYFVRGSRAEPAAEPPLGTLHETASSLDDRPIRQPFIVVPLHVGADAPGTSGLSPSRPTAAPAGGLGRPAFRASMPLRPLPAAAPMARGKLGG